MRAALAAMFLAACYAPDARGWTDPGPDAPPAPAMISLTVTIMGPGRITVEDVGTCDSKTAPHGTCSFNVPANAMRQLQATPTNEDHPFSGWTQACTGKVATCSLLLVTSPTQVGAKFQ
jgi:hypothetical protein